VKEIFMSMFIRATLIAIAVLAGVSAASARTDPFNATGRTLSSFDLNDPNEVRNFWEAQRRHGN
jgi:hypothetical protein